jgi:hypothetical protein
LVDGSQFGLASAAALPTPGSRRAIESLLDAAPDGRAPKASATSAAASAAATDIRR